MSETADVGQVLAVAPVVPVVVFEDAAHAVPVARALLRGGVGIIEITLRSAAGLDAIRRVATELPQMVVGAGTIVRPQQVQDAVAAGASFLVTPGSPEKLLAAALDAGIPVLAGASTITEMMRLTEHGLESMKFFPAEASGGRGYLSAVAGPLPGLRFCPTGGITAQSAPHYLALPSVPCVGGSWLTPVQALREGRWDVVQGLAAQAADLRQGNLR